MKTLIFLSIAFSMAYISFGQYVEITDTTFLNALIEKGVEMNMIV